MDILEAFAQRMSLRFGSSLHNTISECTRTDLSLSDRGDKKELALPALSGACFVDHVNLGSLHFPILFSVLGFFLEAKHEDVCSASSRQCSAGMNPSGMSQTFGMWQIALFLRGKRSVPSALTTLRRKIIMLLHTSALHTRFDGELI